jgi:two-component system, LuxR family, sensor kinase FixL
MSKPDMLVRRAFATVLTYGLACMSVAVALLVTLLSRPNELVTPVFFLAIMLSAWFGGTGPGLLAALLATLAIAYYFLPPPYSLQFDPANVPHLLVFFLAAVLVSSWSAARKRAETLLRRARDAQEAKVQERTADLNQANETLRERADLLDLTHDTVFVRDLRDVITYWNHGAVERYGWPKAEAVGQVSHALLQTIFPAPLEEIHAELLGRGRWEGELVHTKRDSTQVVVASRWALQRDAQGSPLAILETNNDLTERKRAEEALQQAQTELAHVTRVLTLGELAASIAHEINQPLAAIVTNGSAGLRWLAGATPSLDDAREALQCIIDDGQRASEVITRIRALLRNTATEKGRLDLPPLVYEIVRLTQPECVRQRVTLRLEMAADLPPVWGDRMQLQQVLLNLVLNALEAMARVAQGRRALVIRARPETVDTVLVAVEDTGVGIAPEHLDQIFTAFYTTKAQGLGMGLAISRTLIEQHGGRLWAVPHDGPGATVQFTLRTAPAAG